MNSLDIDKDLRAPQVDGAELNYVLLSFFGSGAYPANNVQRFTKHDAPGSLEVEYSKKGNILRATTDLPRDEIRALSNQIVTNLIDNQVQKIVGVTCFADEYIRGAFRYKDLFQVLPAGPEFPDAPSAWADHPFILQLRFTSSPHTMINSMRTSPLVTKYVRYLNAICRSGVASGTRNTGFCWCIDSEANPPKTRWMQQGYWPPSSGLSHEPSEYQPVDSLITIPAIPANEYYERRTYRPDREFCIPDNIESLLSKILNLPAEQRKRFDLACTWLAMARDISPASSSAAYISMVAAIEALLDKKSETCHECGQPKFSVTKKLKEFLQRFVPGIEAQELNRIYRVRSDLAHGLDLLLRDLGQLGMTSPGAASEMTLQYTTLQVAKIAVLNWLQSQ